MHLVIALYNEDLTWLNQLSFNHTIYNKGNSTIDSIPLPNIGRESDTFLNYILNNYHNLPDTIAFLQGNPFPHCGNIIQRLKEYNSNELEGLNGGLFYNKIDGCPTHCGLRIAEVYQKLFNINNNPDEVYFTTGGQYIVPKRYITNKTYSWWEQAYSIHQEYIDDSPWVYERLWPYIYNYSNL